MVKQKCRLSLLRTCTLVPIEQISEIIFKRLYVIDCLDDFKMINVNKVGICLQTLFLLLKCPKTLIKQKNPLFHQPMVFWLAYQNHNR